jgi:hypothetical protein
MGWAFFVGVSGLGPGLPAGWPPRPLRQWRMTFFYWFMAFVMAATFLPSAFFMGVYVFTGEDAALDRARKLWNYLRVFTLLVFNLTLWGHVVVGFWQLIS